ncbi:DMT family transporter [Carboxylicivirga sp. N1Y90]|uniref:DMT family transporter n=1 Tax=Carboxylicivirga fragile TaxID=3417571 RepID=UPI003D331C26|nr:DMT family transporter [Marinilabiliaceae bacterium N1Y90]
MKLKKHQLIVAVLMAALGVIMFSAKAVMVKMAYAYNVDSVTLLLLRMSMALPIYIVIASIESSKKNRSKLKSKDYYSLIALGILGYYLASYLDFEGLKHLSAGMERLILFIYPTLVVIISALFLKQRINKYQIRAIIITYLGVFIAFYKYSSLSDSSTNIPLGALLIFGSALSYAIYLVGSGDLIPRIGSVRFTAYAMIVSCTAVILHYIIMGNGSDVFNQVPQVYALGAAMAIISTVIPSFLLSEAIKRIGAANVAIIGSLGPISTIVLAVIFLGEVITIYQAIGTFIVILGVLLIMLKKEKG